MTTTAAPLQLQQQQLILRLPDELATKVHALVKQGQHTSKTTPASLIDVKPQNLQIPSDDFVFILNGIEYPALLLNLPTPLESHKTFDNKIFLKSADVGQMLQVFHSEKEREVARGKIVHTANGDYHPSGLTPPTSDVVRRRFELARKSSDSFLPYKVRQVCEEIGMGVDSVTGGSVFNEAPAFGAKKVGGSRRGGGGALDEEEGEVVVMESVVEEVVDFEEWMADPLRPGHGRALTVCGADWSTSDAQLLQLHPEALLTQVDAEEDALEALAAQQIRAEKESVAAAVTSAAELLQQQSEPDDTEDRAGGAKQRISIGLQGAQEEAEAATEALRLSFKMKPDMVDTTISITSSSSQSPRGSGSHNAEEDQQLLTAQEEDDDEQQEEGEGSDSGVALEEEDEDIDEDSDSLHVASAEAAGRYGGDDEAEEEEDSPAVIGGGTAADLMGSVDSAGVAMEVVMVERAEDEDKEEEGELVDNIEDRTAGDEDNGDEEEDDDAWMNSI